MSIFSSQDNLVAIAAGAIVLLLAVAFTGLYLNVSETKRTTVAYSSFEPINIKSRGFAIRATIAIQTRAGQSEWALRNRSKLENVFKKTMSAADPVPLQKAEGIQALQIQLKEDANRALDSDNLEAVYFTDFLIMEDAG